MAPNQPPFRLIFNPQTAADLGQLDQGAKALLVASLHKAALNGTPPGWPVEGEDELAGVRWAAVHTEASRAQGLPDAAVTYSIHPTSDSTGVINVIAARAVADPQALAALYAETAARIAPVGHDRVQAFSQGVSGDLKQLRTVGGRDYELTRSAINALTTDGSGVYDQPGVDPFSESGEQLPAPAVPRTDPASGTELGMHQGADLRGTFRMTYDTPEQLAAGKPTRFAVIYQVLDPPKESTVYKPVLNVVKAGPLGSERTYMQAAARLNALSASAQQQAGREQGQGPSRAAGARRQSTQGTGPQAQHSDRPAAARTRSSRHDRGHDRSGPTR